MWYNKHVNDIQIAFQLWYGKIILWDYEMEKGGVLLPFFIYDENL